MDRDSYLVRTMETASLRMLSPNTSMLRTGSTLRALKMAMVATGSTAEISEPKAKLQQGRREREWVENNSLIVVKRHFYRHERPWKELRNKHIWAETKHQGSQWKQEMWHNHIGHTYKNLVNNPRETVWDVVKQINDFFGLSTRVTGQIC